MREGETRSEGQIPVRRDERSARSERVEGGERVRWVRGVQEVLGVVGLRYREQLRAAEGGLYRQLEVLDGD